MFKKKEGASDRTFINNKQVASYLKIGGGGGKMLWNNKNSNVKQIYKT